MPEQENSAMPKFVTEREIVGAGKLPKQELQAISQKSCSVLQSMGPKIQWVQSYVTHPLSKDAQSSSTENLTALRVGLLLI
jgi:Protein of unknown function (DUF4242)